MAKLNQLVAVAKGVKSDVYATVTQNYHKLQKFDLFAGLSRTYRPVNDDAPESERLPDENKFLQARAEDVLDDVGRELARLFDVTATVDFTNTKAVADVTVGDLTLVHNAPVPYLLFLEKQLKDLEAFVRKLPVLDPAREWVKDDNVSAYRSGPVTTKTTRKTPRNHVKAPATDKHPAQVEVYYEDVTVGFWDTTYFSGSLPLARVKQILERIDTLRQAVKFAREQANMTEVIDGRGTGKRLMDYLLAP